MGANYFWFEIPLCASTLPQTDVENYRNVDLYIFHIFCQSANNGEQISTLTVAIALEWFYFYAISIICIRVGECHRSFETPARIQDFT